MKIRVQRQFRHVQTKVQAEGPISQEGLRESLSPYLSDTSTGRVRHVASCFSGSATFLPVGKSFLCLDPIIIDILRFHLVPTLLIPDNLLIVSSLISSLLPTSLRGHLQVLEIGSWTSWVPLGHLQSTTASILVAPPPGPLTPKKAGFFTVLPFPHVLHALRGAWEAVLVRGFPMRSREPQDS